MSDFLVCAFLFRFLCYLISWNPFKIYIQKATFLCIVFNKSPMVLSVTCSPIPLASGSPLSHLSRTLAHLFKSSLDLPLPHLNSLLNLIPLAPSVRASCTVPQSSQFHQFYVMWVHMKIYWKEWFLCFRESLESVDLLFMCCVPFQLLQSQSLPSQSTVTLY